MSKLMRFLIPVVCLLFVALVILQVRPYAHAASTQRSAQGSSQSQASAVASVSWAPNRIDYFVVGNDHAVYHKWWNGQRWSGWENHGGYVISSISSVSWAANRIDLFVVGSDHALYHQWWDGANRGPSLTGYENQGGYALVF